MPANTPFARTASRPAKGATDEQISAVANFQSGPFSPKEKLGSFFAELHADFSEPELVELFLTAAAFEMFRVLSTASAFPSRPLPPRNDRLLPMPTRRIATRVSQLNGEGALAVFSRAK